MTGLRFRIFMAEGLCFRGYDAEVLVHGLGF